MNRKPVMDLIVLKILKKSAAIHYWLKSIQVLMHHLPRWCETRLIKTNYKCLPINWWVLRLKQKHVNKMDAGIVPL